MIPGKVQKVPSSSPTQIRGAKRDEVDEPLNPDAVPKDPLVSTPPAEIV